MKLSLDGQVGFRGFEREEFCDFAGCGVDGDEPADVGVGFSGSGLNDRERDRPATLRRLSPTIPQDGPWLAIGYAARNANLLTLYGDARHSCPPSSRYLAVPPREPR